jgi:hypothetical protein
MRHGQIDLAGQWPGFDLFALRPGRSHVKRFTPAGAHLDVSDLTNLYDFSNQKQEKGPVGANRQGPSFAGARFYE